MVDESVLGLSPIATTILQAVSQGGVVSLDTITQHVVASFGEPEGSVSAEEITRQQIWDLVAHKVLVVADDWRIREQGPSSPNRRPAPPSEDASAGAVAAVRAALHHLRSITPGRWAAPPGVSSSALVAAARQHHVVPYLVAHLDRLVLPAQANSEMSVMAGRQRSGARLLAADLAMALEALDSVGVRVLVFKGVALATQAYGDYAIRGAGDLDLLVAPSDLVPAYEALTRAGWRSSPGFPTLRASWAWRHFVRTGNELTLTGHASDIDLHWHLAPVRGTFPDFDTLWGRRSIVTMHGHLTPTFAPYDALAHSSSHAAKDGWRWLRSLLDVHTLMSSSETWRSADRPLRADQLISVGLAARAFGTPLDAPTAVASAAERVPDKLLARILRDQEVTAPMHQPLLVPGLDFIRRLSALGLTKASPEELARLLSRSMLPPWLTAEESSPTAIVAVPRVLRRRALEVGNKVATRRRAHPP